MAILKPPESIGTIRQLLAVSVLNWQGLALIVQLWALAGRDKARKTGGVALWLKKRKLIQVSDFKLDVSAKSFSDFICAAFLRIWRHYFCARICIVDLFAISNQS